MDVLAELQRVKHIVPTVDPSQDALLQHLLTRLHDGCGCLVIASPGYGKTYVSIAIIYSLRKRTLVITKASLIQQFICDFKAALGDEAPPISSYNGGVDIPELGSSSVVVVAYSQALNYQAALIVRGIKRADFGLAIVGKSYLVLGAGLVEERCRCSGLEEVPCNQAPSTAVTRVHHHACLS